jgi:hypothetical protein
MDGNSSLHIAGTTDQFGNVVAAFAPPYKMDFSKYQTFSFWGAPDQVFNWVLLLRDQSGHQASYWMWNGQTGGGILPSDTGHFKRLMTNLRQPTTEDSGFDYSKVVLVAILADTMANKHVSFSIDDLVLDEGLFPTSYVFKRGIAIGQLIQIDFLTYQG